MNRSGRGPAPFDGINVDIEPYLLEAWDADRQRLAKLYLELSERYREMTDEYGFQGPVGPAIPFWYDGIPVEEDGTTRPLSERVQDLYDYVAIMAYRDRAEGRDDIVRHVKNEVDYAQRSGGRGGARGVRRIRWIRDPPLRELPGVGGGPRLTPVQFSPR